MRIILTWQEPKEKIIEMTPEEWCNFRASKTVYENYFPKNAKYIDFNIADKESREELDNFFFKGK